MTPDEIYTNIARVLNEHYYRIELALIKPEARLEEDLNLEWDDVDSLFADFGSWSDWHAWHRFPGDATLDYWTVYRGLDRHFLSPYRERDERNRLNFIGRSVPSESQTITLEPLTVADIVRILHAKRYVCATPPAGLEETVTRTVGVFSKNRSQHVTLDSRLREDLEFEWALLNRALASVDQQLAGAFYWGSRGRTWNKALLYWKSLELLPGTRSITVRDLIATVRENRWIGPMPVDWRSSFIPAMERGTLTYDEILDVIRWTLIERGLDRAKVSFRTKLKWGMDAIEALSNLETIMAGRFVFSEEIRKKIFPIYFTLRVSDLIRIVRENRWVEPRRWRWLKWIGLRPDGAFLTTMSDQDQKIETQASRTVDEEYLADCDLYVKEQLERIERGDRTLAAIDRERFLYDEYYRLGCDSLARRLDTIREGMARAEVIRMFSWEPIFGGLSDAFDPSLLSGLEKRLSNPLTAEQAWVLKEAIDRLQLVTVAVAAPNEYIEPKVFVCQHYLETVLQWLDYADRVLRWPNKASDGWGLFEIAYQDERLRECLERHAAGGFPWFIYSCLRGKWRNEARMAFVERGYLPWREVNSCRKHWWKWWKKTPQGPSDAVHEAALPCPRCNRPADQLTWLYYREPVFLSFKRGWLTICESCHLQVDYFDDLIGK